LQSDQTENTISDVEKTTPQSRLEKLREKKAQIDAQIKNVEARERQQARKDETRRKIIAGALALHHMENNPDGPFSKTLLRLLDEYVIRSNERRLFGLSPLPDEAGQSHANDASGKKGKLKEDFQARES
jgi:hypothetical protein